jgi:hypothetical protein
MLGEGNRALELIAALRPRSTGARAWLWTRDSAPAKNLNTKWNRRQDADCHECPANRSPLLIRKAIGQQKA